MKLTAILAAAFLALGSSPVVHAHRHDALVTVDLAVLVASGPDEVTVTAEPAPATQAQSRMLAIAGEQPQTWQVPVVYSAGIEAADMMEVVYESEAVADVEAPRRVGHKAIMPLDGLGNEVPEVFVRENGSAGDWPSAPVRILRSSRYRSQLIAVYEISAFFRNNGLRRLKTMQLRLKQARMLRSPLDLLDDTSGGSKIRKPKALSTSTVVAPPYNSAARTMAWKVKVNRPGLQRVTAGTLTGYGITASATLCLSHMGRAIPLQILDGGDGALAGNDEIRFFAAEAGDRYNSESVFWLRTDPACTAASESRMSVRPSAVISYPVVRTAWQHGLWRQPAAYLANQAGWDGDHWFGAYLQSMSAPASWTLALPPGLPAVPGGTATYSVDGVSRLNAPAGLPHRATLAGSGWSDTAMWSGHGAFTVTFSVPAAVLPSVFTLQLRSGAPDIVLPDSVTWQRPIQLNFGGQGACFDGEDGPFAYQLSGHPEARLYDVTDPGTPVVVNLDANGRFQDNAGRKYVMAGSGTLFDPVLEPYTPSLPDLSTALNKRVLYVAPGAMINNLAPLINLRNQQGWSAQAIPVEAIYALWSSGQVSPEAIRNFLQYAYATWAVKPEAVVLVGDASADPLNHSGRSFAHILPAYLADVDPYQGDFGLPGETACDSCFAQLDGGVLSDMVPDLIVGRIPAKSPDELDVVVNKIISYESNTAGFQTGSWRNTIGFISDNYIKPNGMPDGAGNFWHFTDKAVVQQPFAMRIRRLYYDPASALSSPWRVGAPTDAGNPAYDGTRAMFNDGAGLIVYIGHSSQNRIGDLDYPGIYDNYFLYGSDAAGLTNGGTLPILISMSCLTGAFHYTYDSDGVRVERSFDEWMVMSANGAIATWGSTGLGVAYGHEALMKGFFGALWRSTSPDKPLGRLTMAGYLTLFAQGTGVGSESIQTYVVLGDPLTRARLHTGSTLRPDEARTVYLPYTRK